MKVLIACECSGATRDAFIARGHDAVSCDLKPTRAPGPHYQGSVFDILGDGWDLMIAHPPCTYLSYAATRVWNSPGRAEKREEALEFMTALYNAPIPRICVENPVGWANTVWRKPDQIIQPYFFGDPYMKTTCLWLKGLPPLVYIPTPKPPPIYISEKTGKHIHFEEAASHFAMPGLTRQERRSVTFPGIANALADQWGNVEAYCFA